MTASSESGPWRSSREGAIARFSLETADRRQTLSPEILRALARGAAAAAAAGATVAVVESAVPGLFAAGADLRAIRDLTAAEGYAYARAGQEALADLAGSRCATVAEIQGPCFGGALDLVMACDVRIAADSAIFCHPGPRFGIVTGWGGTFFAPRILGIARARRLFREGEVFDASGALALGLIDEVIPAGSWEDRRRELEGEIAEAASFLWFREWCRRSESNRHGVAPAGF